MKVTTQIHTVEEVVLVQKPMLQLALTFEEAQMLLALGATTTSQRRDFIERTNINAGSGRSYDDAHNCAVLLGELYFAASDFVHTNSK